MSPAQRTSTDSVVPIGKWPVPWASACPEWLGDLEVELPLEMKRFGIPLLGILSSHRTRHEPLRAEWEKALESALGLAKRTQSTVFFASLSPYSDRLRHACSRFGIPCLELSFGTKGQKPSSKMAILRNAGNPLIGRCEIADIPIEDRAIAILSHQLFVIHVRRGGRIARLMEARLSEESMTFGSTLLAVERSGGARVRNAAAKHMSELGAVLWLPVASSLSHSESTGRVNAWGCSRRSCPATWMPVGQASRSLLDSDDFLIHFTRGRVGAWPDQSVSQLFDEAIRLEWFGEASPLKTLHRILANHRLIASSRLRRGSIRTVCFTAQSLRNALGMRVFQTHLGRWDWEPYGIAIRRGWLASQGARPVEYAHPHQIDQMTSERQAFAQPLPIDERHRDWSIEREWRIQDDVRLSTIPSDQAFVFVRSRQEANLLSPWSRWPVVHLPREVA